MGLTPMVLAQDLGPSKPRTPIEAARTRFGCLVRDAALLAAIFRHQLVCPTRFVDPRREYHSNKQDFIRFGFL